jgi:3-deoxy-7-phosphoheptulonate synthase
MAAVQQPSWQEPGVYAASVKELSTLPPLVFAGEVDVLRERLAAAAQGKAFLLQGGDCAETFDGATADKISARVRTILQMAVVLTYGASLPVIKMGRMAGQFAKPRSSNDETRDGVTLPAYRGDMVNGYEFSPESRGHDAARMVKAYHTSASTLNLIRAFTQGGFADLRLVHHWNKGFMANPAHSRYESLAREIDRAVRFMDACGADFEALKRVEFFASHEASPTTPPHTSSGSGSGPARSTAPTWTSSPGCATRSGSSSGPRPRATTPWHSSTSSTRTGSRAGSPSSRAWEPGTSGRSCRSWSSA